MESPPVRVGRLRYRAIAIVLDPTRGISRTDCRECARLRASIDPMHYSLGLVRLLEGLDAARVVEVISQGAAQSWQLDNRSETMLADEFDFGFAVDWMRKDLGIALAEADRIGATLDVTALVDRYYAEVQERGGGRRDTSSLITRLR